MAHFYNPGGRIIAEDNPKMIADLEKTPGFRRLTPDEEKNWVEERTAMVDQLKAQADLEPDKGIYLATVSQGGKDGYGIASSALIQELKNLDLPVSTHNQGQKIGVLFHNPYSILQIESPFRIIYTMFESDKIPDDWKDYLEAADMVIVPSKWCQEVFKKAGVETKVVPLGYNDRVFKYVKRTNKRKQNKTFTFLHYNAFNIRKGFAEVWKAFTEEFEKDEPVKLILKTTLNTIPLPITKQRYPNVEIINEPYTDLQMQGLCERSDCFVFPSRGEGFGITPLEAMATGLSVIVPNAHGITEYFDGDLMYEVKIKETCPGLYSRYKGQDVGKMVICDVADLRRQMRYIYEHQDEAIQRSEKAAEYVKQWTFEQTAIKLKALFDEIFAKPIADKPLRNVLRLEAV